MFEKKFLRYISKYFIKVLLLYTNEYIEEKKPIIKKPTNRKRNKIK